jgi:hypothetical protein
LLAFSATCHVRLVTQSEQFIAWRFGNMGRTRSHMLLRPHPLAIVAMALVASVVSGQTEPPPRTFPQFVGTWILDEAASTGRLNITPRIALSMTIATTPEQIAVTKRPRLGPSDRSSASPPAEVYRLDGIETWQSDERTGVLLDRSYRFTLVADMLALTVKDGPRGGGRFTMVTDAYSVDGDVLTVHRQLTSVSASGRIATMQEPTNNFRHTFIYRRAPTTPPN